MKTVLTLTLLALLGTTPAPVPYPEGYRGWSHVKSTLIGPTHPRYATWGGYQHIYANTLAMEGYRTRSFPEGSVIVLDWVLAQETNGMTVETGHRQLDVMVKDSTKYAASGGWGFQRFMGTSRTELSTTLTPPQCFGCHQNLGKDGLVLSHYRE